MSPDILLFISDQHAPQYQAGGQMPVDTPNLAALRGQGTALRSGAHGHAQRAGSAPYRHFYQ